MSTKCKISEKFSLFHNMRLSGLFALTDRAVLLQQYQISGAKLILDLAGLGIYKDIFLKRPLDGSFLP